MLARLLHTRIADQCPPVPDSRDLVAGIAPAFTLIVADPADHYFGEEHSRSLYEWAAEPKDLWLLPGTGHGTDLLSPALADRLLWESWTSVSRPVDGLPDRFVGGMSLPVDTLGARPPRVVTVDPDRVLAYAAATNDDNPAYLSGRFAPPVFGVVPAWDPLIAAVFDIVPPEKKPVMLHAGHDMRFAAPIVPGTTLSTVAEPFSVRPSRAGTWVTVRAVSVDLDTGDQVLEQFGTMFVRGWSDVEALRARPPRPLVPVRRPGASRWRWSRRTVDADQTWRYAAASGDDNRIHVDDEFARGVGLPGIILHGLCTMAMCSRAVIEGVAGRRPHPPGPPGGALLQARPARVRPGHDHLPDRRRPDGSSFAFEATSGASGSSATAGPS